MALTDIEAGRLADNVFNVVGANKNLIINGAMQVAQRGTSTTGVTGSSYNGCDRWRMTIGNLGTWTIQQSTDAPAGFSNSFRVLCTTADASPASDDNISVGQRIEGQNLQHIFSDKSAGDTQVLALSFWVKASRSGDASIVLRQPDNSNRQFTVSYNIAAIDTWEHKVISIPADDSAVINNDNGSGLEIQWWLNSGSAYTGGTRAAGWEATDSANQNVDNLGIGQAVDDDFLITGVQLEVGSVATPFEHRSYGDELRRCQRYYYKVTADVGNVTPFGPCAGQSETRAIAYIAFPTTMRAAPTSLEQTGTASDYYIRTNTDNTCSSVPLLHDRATTNGCMLNVYISSGLSAGYAAIFGGNIISSYLAFPAEL